MLAAEPERMQRRNSEGAGNAHLDRDWCGGYSHVDLVCLASPVRLPATHMRRALHRDAAGAASASVCYAPLPGPSRGLAVQNASSLVMQNLHLSGSHVPQCRSMELWYQLERFW